MSEEVAAESPRPQGRVGSVTQEPFDPFGYGLDLGDHENAQFEGTEEASSSQETLSGDEKNAEDFDPFGYCPSPSR